MRKLLIIVFAIFSLHAYANDTNDTNDDNKLIGIWAMLPLNNGIANVTEFREDGTSLLYPFNCNSLGRSEPTEISNYVINEKDQVIHLSSPSFEIDLRIRSLGTYGMRLEQNIGDVSLLFTYIKMDSVMPLCALYELSKDKPKKGRHKEDDFISASLIPENSGIERFIAQWVNKKNERQIEIAQDDQGQIYLKNDSGENWHYLYNNVRWINNELHYTSYAYSDKEELFDHPYHKAIHQNIIQFISDDEILYSFFIHENRYDIVLFRKANE